MKNIILITLLLISTCTFSQGLFVNISDHPDPSLNLKRKMEVFCFKPDWRGGGTVEVFMRVHHYKKAANNAYGAELISPSIANYEDRLVASNERKVDPTDGMELYKQNLTDSTFQYKRVDTNVVVNNGIGQFDFFDYIIRNTPVVIQTMLSNFIQFEDIVHQRWNK
jgi:hypothetical protein